MPYSPYAKRAPDCLQPSSSPQHPPQHCSSMDRAQGFGPEMFVRIEPVLSIKTAVGGQRPVLVLRVDW